MPANRSASQQRVYHGVGKRDVDLALSNHADMLIKRIGENLLDLEAGFGAQIFDQKMMALIRRAMRVLGRYAYVITSLSREAVISERFDRSTGMTVSFVQEITQTSTIMKMNIRTVVMALSLADIVPDLDI
jgi:hypothetical protein